MIKIRDRFIITSLVGILLVQAGKSYAEDVTKEDANELAKKVADKMKKTQEEEKWESQEYYKLGVSYFKDKRFLDALREFEKANEIEPDNKKILGYLKKTKAMVENEADRYFSNGIKLYKQKKLDDARREFEKVPAESSKYQEGQQYIAKVNADKETARLEAEAREAKEKKDAEEKEREELLKKGKEAYKRNDYKEAVEAFTTLSSRYPQDEEIQEWRKLSQSGLDRLGEKESAKKEKERTEKEGELTLLKKEAHEKAMMLEVEKKYLPPVRGEAGVIVTPETRGEDERTRQIKLMKEKLSEIKVPEVNFNNVDIREVIRTLAKMTGVNIFIDEVEMNRLSSGLPPTPAPVAAIPAGPFPGGPPGAEVAPVSAPPAAGVSSLNVTIKTYSEMPLLNLLEYALNSTGLAYRVEPSYIFISTPEKIKVQEQTTISYKLKYGVTKRRLVAPITPETLLGTTGTQ